MRERHQTKAQNNRIHPGLIYINMRFCAVIILNDYSEPRSAQWGSVSVPTNNLSEW